MPTDQPIKNHSKRARHLLLVSGIAVLLWSGMEDSDALLVTLLGALLATAAGMMLLATQRFRPVMARGRRPLQGLLAGALIGALAGVATPLLMLFKNLRHAHIFPDYPAGMMLATLERIPAWALAGGLAGLGIGLLLKLGADWRHSH
ncbi:MAG: hypothetical protein OXG68_01440 [Chloroflexi bacterium]|nr:hypothetical protein [Chloroflexota bacterium]